MSKVLVSCYIKAKCVFSQNVLKAYNSKLSILTCCALHFVFFVELIKFCYWWNPNLTVNFFISAPCPNSYIKINPVKVTLDTYTMTWFNSFALSLAKDVVCTIFPLWTVMLLVSFVLLLSGVFDIFSLTKSFVKYLISNSSEQHQAQFFP